MIADRLVLSTPVEDLRPVLLPGAFRASKSGSAASCRARPPSHHLSAKASCRHVECPVHGRAVQRRQLGKKISNGETQMTPVSRRQVLGSIGLAAGAAGTAVGLAAGAAGACVGAGVAAPPQAASKMLNTTSILTNIKRVFIFATPPEF